MSREVARPWSRLLSGQSDQYGVPREVQHAIGTEVGRGQVRAARAQADAYVASIRVAGVGFVTHQALGEAAGLHEIATHHSVRMPHAADDLMGMARAGTAVMRNEIIKLGLEP